MIYHTRLRLLLHARLQLRLRYTRLFLPRWLVWLRCTFRCYARLRLRCRFTLVIPGLRCGCCCYAFCHIAVATLVAGLLPVVTLLRYGCLVAVAFGLRAFTCRLRLVCYLRFHIRLVHNGWLIYIYIHLYPYTFYRYTLLRLVVSRYTVVGYVYYVRVLIWTVGCGFYSRFTVGLRSHVVSVVTVTRLLRSVWLLLRLRSTLHGYVRLLHTVTLPGSLRYVLYAFTFGWLLRLVGCWTLPTRLVVTLLVTRSHVYAFGYYICTLFPVAIYLFYTGYRVAVTALPFCSGLWLLHFAVNAPPTVTRLVTVVDFTFHFATHGYTRYGLLRFGFTFGSHLLFPGYGRVTLRCVAAAPRLHSSHRLPLPRSAHTQFGYALRAFRLQLHYGYALFTTVWLRLVTFRCRLRLRRYHTVIPLLRLRSGYVGCGYTYGLYVRYTLLVGLVCYSSARLDIHFVGTAPLHTPHVATVCRATFYGYAHYTVLLFTLLPVVRLYYLYTPLLWFGYGSVVALRFGSGYVHAHYAALPVTLPHGCCRLVTFVTVVHTALPHFGLPRSTLDTHVAALVYVYIFAVVTLVRWLRLPRAGCYAFVGCSSYILRYHTFTVVTRGLVCSHVRTHLPLHTFPHGSAAFAVCHTATHGCATPRLRFTVTRTRAVTFGTHVGYALHGLLLRLFTAHGHVWFIHATHTLPHGYDFRVYRSVTTLRFGCVFVTLPFTGCCYTRICWLFDCGWFPFDSHRALLPVHDTVYGCRLVTGYGYTNVVLVVAWYLFPTLNVPVWVIPGYGCALVTFTHLTLLPLHTVTIPTVGLRLRLLRWLRGYGCPTHTPTAPLHGCVPVVVYHILRTFVAVTRPYV